MEMGMQSQVIETRSHQGILSSFVGFILKIVTMIFLTVDISGAFIYLLYKREFQWIATIPIILAFFAGFSSGILCRLFFFRMPRIVRWFFSCLAVIGTLAVGGLAGQYWMQIDLTGIRSAAVNNDFLILSLVGWAIAFVTVFAWSSKKKQVIDPAPEIETVSEYTPDPIVYPTPAPVLTPIAVVSGRPMVRTRNTSQKIRWRRLKKQLLKRIKTFIKPGRQATSNPLFSLFRPGTRTRVGERRRTTNSLQIRVPERLGNPTTSLPIRTPKKTSNRRHHKTVRFVGKEEMRCPYCLQIIDPKDPKGIVYCPICHAPHHKECWDITGTCQVPHNHNVL